MRRVMLYPWSMSELTLVRLTRSPTAPTFGVLMVAGVPVLLTLELPERFNAPNVSCIPAGRYVANKTENRHTSSGSVIPVTLEVVVPGRSGILFHVGNTVADTHGCILVGMEFASHGLAYSRVAMDKFEELISDETDYEIDIIYGSGS